ncbi:hypothetical protein Tco_0506217 [Tanacetum coccineum]
MLAQVSNRGNVRNQNGNVVNENVQENVRNVMVNGNWVGCLYKEFLACNLKEYDGKGGVVVLTRWIKKMENVQDMSGCSNDQKVKYTAGHFHEMQKMESELWNHAMVGAGHAAYTDRFHELARSEDGGSNGAKNYTEGDVDFWSGRDDNKSTRTGNVFATTLNPIRRENMGHLVKDCRGVPRNVNTINARNPTVRACYEYGSTNHVRLACPRMNTTQRPEENRPNQVAANNGGLEPSELGFKYEIEIASGQLVEIDKVMDWLSNYKAEIIFYEKVVRIPLPDGKVLRVVGERPEKKERLLMSAKASDKKQEEIVVVRDFPEVFSDDLSRLPLVQEIEFQIELIPGATPVAKSLL